MDHTVRVLLKELDRKSEFVFTGRNGKAVLNRGQVREAFEKARKAQGLKISGSTIWDTPSLPTLWGCLMMKTMVTILRDLDKRGTDGRKTEGGVLQSL